MRKCTLVYNIPNLDSRFNQALNYMLPQRQQLLVFTG